MNTDKHRFLDELGEKSLELEALNPLTERIIGCAIKVSNGLGVGFLEKVYQNALAHELRKTGLNIEQESPIRVIYDGIIVGEYFVDLVVEKSILVELKAVKALDEIHQAQCLNYLKATDMRVCLLLNFGKTKLEIKRFVR